MTAYVDLATIHVPATGTAPPATWGQQVRDNFDNVHGSDLTWIPQVDQGATTNIAKTVLHATYIQMGNVCFAWMKVVTTGAGTAGQMITATIPVTATFSAGSVGAGYIADSDGAVAPNTTVSAYLTSATQIGFIPNLQSNFYGITPSMALANSDVIDVFVVYLTA